MRKYNIYATLLDTFQNYLDSDKIYSRYWGNSENPPHTPKEFEQLQYQAVLDRINRVPFDSDAADRGTCFNEIIDCIVERRKSDKMELLSTDTTIKAKYKEKEFIFVRSQILDAAKVYKNAVSQVLCLGILKFDDIEINLYGYIDELFFSKVVDIKTTSRTPQAFAFRDHWQHRVYPYCLNEMGAKIDTFEYHHYVLNEQNNITAFVIEPYPIDLDRIKPDLINICTLFTQFIELNKEKITDKKIFNL